MDTNQKQTNRYRMLIQYDGHNYCGWQRQPNATSVQECIENALKILYKEPIALTGSGRTDSRVHALGQVAHFNSPQDHNLQKILLSLNGILDHSIRIQAIEKCHQDFHARYSAKGKIYEYRICTNRFSNPLKMHYCYHFPQKIHEDLLHQACQMLTGTHDFKALANENHRGSASINSVRTLYKVQASPLKDGWKIHFFGNGFLYKMVRNCVGLILDIATAKRPLEEIQSILKQTHRPQKLSCVPGQGLCLVKVLYPQETFQTSVVSFLENELSP